jgi:hypothetical protein
MRQFVFSCRVNLEGAPVTVTASSEEEALRKIKSHEWENIELCSASITDVRVDRLLAAEVSRE